MDALRRSLAGHRGGSKERAELVLDSKEGQGRRQSKTKTKRSVS